jgi:hypothetical protein
MENALLGKPKIYQIFKSLPSYYGTRNLIGSST